MSKNVCYLPEQIFHGALSIPRWQKMFDILPWATFYRVLWIPIWRNQTLLLGCIIINIHIQWMKDVFHIENTPHSIDLPWGNSCGILVWFVFYADKFPRRYSICAKICIEFPKICGRKFFQTYDFEFRRCSNTFNFPSLKCENLRLEL